MYIYKNNIIHTYTYLQLHFYFFYDVINQLFMIRQLYPAGKWQHSFHPCVTPVKRVDHLLLPADFGALTSCREAPDVPGPTNYPTRPPERQREK